MDNERKYMIRSGRQLVPVSKDIYIAYHKMKRREKYLYEDELEQGTVSYNAWDSEDNSGEAIIADSSANVEEIVLIRLMISELYRHIEKLTRDEKRIIHEIYDKGRTEKEAGQALGLPQQTVNYRKNRILQKLKSFFENK